MNWLEAFLVKHCSPTLAALKTANLFNCCCPDERELRENVEYWNDIMIDKGIKLFVMRYGGGRALIYVCRLPDLQKRLSDPQIVEFLSRYGYESDNVMYSINRLRTRLCEENGFPHEIGVFLGYPLEDVRGFIDNGGKGFLCAGIWKVYNNLDEAEKAFYRFKKCSDIYMHLWESGKSVCQLTVAA